MGCTLAPHKAPSQRSQWAERGGGEGRRRGAANLVEHHCATTRLHFVTFNRWTGGWWVIGGTGGSFYTSSCNRTSGPTPRHPRVLLSRLATLTCGQQGTVTAHCAHVSAQFVERISEHGSTDFQLAITRGTTPRS